MNKIKKQSHLIQVNYSALELARSSDVVKSFCYVDAEMDEIWSCLTKEERTAMVMVCYRHNSSKVLAYVLGRRKRQGISTP